MIFFARQWHGRAWAEPERAPASLGLFAGRPADSHADGDDLFSELPAPRAAPRKGWRVSRSPSGWPALLSGWIDNARELAGELGLERLLPSGRVETLYGAAVERWGDAADARIVGNYCALVCLPDGTLRLARSPWGGKPLFYHAGADVFMACSIPRPIFAAGHPKRLRRDALDCLLRMQVPDDGQSAFEGIAAVPQGAIVHIERDRARTLRWYDPLAVRPVRLRRDEDYVEAANAILGEAVAAALGPAKKPGIMLSGGLDSAIVCDEMLRQMPAGQRLGSFTFHPLAEWDGRVDAHKFGDDRPWVEAFAAMHPALDPTFVDNRAIGFDDRAERVFLACDAGYPARVAGSHYHGLYDAARESGCDWLFGADSGNLTFSSGAPWAEAEFLRTGQWGQLWRIIVDRLNDPRPVWRRLAALAIMPNLPGGLQRRLRALTGRGEPDERLANPFLRADRAAAADAFARPSISGDLDLSSRESCIRDAYRGWGPGAEAVHGYEQVFGLRLRDVTNYRPLLEFCFGLPTTQFVRHGERRFLARRMAIGRMPEAQRTNRLYGAHNVDWHARLTPRRDELRAQVTALASIPEVAAFIDAPRMLAAIDDWPDRAPDEPLEAARLQFFLPATIYVARYVDFVTGRNSP